MKNDAPKAAGKEFYTNYHKEKNLDPYFWLREKQNPKVIEHLKKENIYFQKKIKPFKKTATKIFKEIKSRIPKLDETVPVKRGDSEFYSRYIEGKQYTQFCKRNGKKIEVLVDFNKFVKKDGYLSVSGIDASPNGEYLAYSFDKTGDEVCDLVVISTKTKKVISHLKKVSGSFEWSTTDLLFYTTLDGHIRQDKVWAHKLGEAQKKDKCVFHEKDQKFFMSIMSSASKKYLIISSGESMTSYSAFMPLNEKNGKVSVFKTKKEGVLYDIDHGNEGFYIHTNEKALNFKVYRCPENKIAQKNWKLVVPHKEDVQILHLQLTEKYLCLSERSKGLPKARIIDVKSNKSYVVKFPDIAYNMNFSTYPFLYNENKIRIHYASPISPKIVYDYDLVKKVKIVRKADKIKGYDSSKYKVEYVFVTGHDKVKIPLCIFYKKGLKQNGQAPAVIYGYGSYGSTIGYNFSSGLVSLLDRGFVYAYAGIRGGTEMGRKWYEEGKFLKKKNTFKDFISCTEYLIKKKYTSPSKLAAKGASAGGLLVGAVANMRPDLYKVICAHVPFVDLVNTMFDDSLPLTLTEYKEWGNPHDKKYYNYMKSYSPYDNIHECAYPNMYITAGLNDQRVTYWEPAKWAQKLRDYNIGDNDVVLKINMGGGHFGKSGRFNSLQESADEFSYLIGKFNQ